VTQAQLLTRPHVDYCEAEKIVFLWRTCRTERLYGTVQEYDATNPSVTVIPCCRAWQMAQWPAKVLVKRDVLGTQVAFSHHCMAQAIRAIDEKCCFLSVIKSMRKLLHRNCKEPTKAVPQARTKTSCSVWKKFDKLSVNTVETLHGLDP